MASHGVLRPTTVVDRTVEQRQQELEEISKYQTLVSSISDATGRGVYDDETFQLTSKLLKKNPEYYTIWNVRKRCLISGLSSRPLDSSSLSTASLNSTPNTEHRHSSEDFSSPTASSTEVSKAVPADLNRQSHGKNGTILDAIQADLRFVVPLLKSWPKCYWIWNHRIWLLELAKERLDCETARTLWKQELALDSVMLTKDNRNFHAWGYRRLLTTTLESEALDGKSMVEEEFAYTTKMINVSLSNFSAWHSRSKLIPRLLDERRADSAARRKFLDDEFDMMRNALWTDSYDQSLWFYYQFLMTTITNHVGHATIVPNFTDEDRIEYVDRQLTDLRDLLDGAEDCKWIYNALFEYTIIIARMQGRDLVEDEKVELRSWLAQLRSLDPLRNGRWDELQGSFHFV